MSESLLRIACLAALRYLESLRDPPGDFGNTPSERRIIIMQLRAALNDE